jgi:hypothetical protein
MSAPTSFSAVSGSGSKDDMSPIKGRAPSTSIFRAAVQDALAADKLKNILAYRRKVAEKLKAHGIPSLTEKVLKFVQSNTDINQLEQLNELRTKRANLRAKGVYYCS